MKLLFFDAMLSPRLVDRLADIYPGSIHVETVGLERASDRAIWEYAREHGYVVVTKDEDFTEMALVLGSPPQVIWIRRGNCSTRDIEMLLRQSYDPIHALGEDTTTGILELV